MLKRKKRNCFVGFLIYDLKHYGGDIICLRPILRCLSAETGVLNNKFITCTILLTRETERAFLLKSIKIQNTILVSDEVL